MSSVIVQMLPNLTLEPAPMAAGVCSTAAKGEALELSSSSSVSEKCALQFNLECLPFLLFLAFCWSWAGAQLLQPQLPHTPLHTLPGAIPPVGPWASRREGPCSRAGRWVWKHSRTCSNILGPCTVKDIPSSHLQSCLPEGAASRAGLFDSSLSSVQAELLIPLQWSQTLLVFCVFKVCILEENSWTYLCISHILSVLQASPLPSTLPIQH